MENFWLEISDVQVWPWRACCKPNAFQESAALVDGPAPVAKPIAPDPADESESDSETGSLNEVAPTLIDPTHSARVGVVVSNSPARKLDVIHVAF